MQLHVSDNYSPVYTTWTRKIQGHSYQRLFRIHQPVITGKIHLYKSCRNKIDLNTLEVEPGKYFEVTRSNCHETGHKKLTCVKPCKPFQHDFFQAQLQNFNGKKVPACEQQNAKTGCCRAPQREATNLAVRVLGWRGVVSRSGMQFVTLRNTIKGVVCAQTSVPFWDAIKTSCLQKIVYTCVSLQFSVLQRRQRSHCHDVKTAKVVMGARKKELGAWRENGGEDRA